MKSIKKKLVFSFAFIIIITVSLIEILLIYAVKVNFYKSLEDNLYSQIKTASDLYTKYFSDSPLYENVLNNVDTFCEQTTAQVQIIDTSGNVLMDSIGVVHNKPLKTDDIKNALTGKKGEWLGHVAYDKSGVMAVAYPIKSNGKIVGALRFVSSLREVNNDIETIAGVFLIIGIIVSIIAVFVSLVISNSIIGPLKQVTLTAEKMASGDLMLRNKKVNDDEVGKLSDTLNYLADEVLKKDELKNDFISSVSHELRTPLTSIKGWAVTLKETGTESEDMLKDGLDIIENESDRLTDMVEELLDFSKFVSGKVTLRKKNINVKYLIEQIEKQMMPRALREEIDFEVIIDNNIANMYNDENRLKQVFINILDNAFKFTPKGGKIIFSSKLNNTQIEFKIIDAGCGISEEELPRVKEKFFKGKSSKSKNGIGLSICDEIIKLMEGSFIIESELNKGTQVTITLPYSGGEDA